MASSFSPVAAGATIVVIGATGTQGSAQMKALLKAGLRPRALCRKPELLPEEARKDAVICDFNDEKAAAQLIENAMQGAFAVFVTPPNFQGVDTNGLVRTVANAAKGMPGVQRIIMNTQAPLNNPGGGRNGWTRLPWEDELAKHGVPWTSLRPGPWMENLFFGFVTQTLEEKGVFEYIHAPGKGKSWVTAEDAAQVMIECLKVEAASKPEGVVLELGGPELVTPEKVSEYLSDVMGQKIPYVFMGYEAFGAGIYNSLARDAGLKAPMKATQKSLEIMYRHWNDHPSEPMNIDNGPLLKLLPNVKLTRMEDWVKQQVWPKVRAPAVAGAGAGSSKL